MSKGKITLLLVGCVIVIGVVASSGGGSSDPAPADTSSGVSTGFGSNDASGDVSLGSCETSYGIVTCKLTIVNHSEGPSDYYVEASFTDDSGANVGFGNATATRIEAGQTAKTELTGVPSSDKGGVTVEITEVQRTASY